MAQSQLRLPRLCEYCGKPFEAKTVATRYCSNACGNRANKERLKREKEEARKQTLLEHAATHIAEIQTRPYITVAEATDLFGISKDTVRRLIKKGKLPAVNLGERLTRISRVHIEEMFTAVQMPEQVEETKSAADNTPQNAINPDDYYTVGDIVSKYNTYPLVISNFIEKHKIQKLKFGRSVYIPKAEFDRLFINRKTRQRGKKQ
ncbi:MAG: helix-turn-helix domain-containing protein [Prevotellaceae bacterium]|jgi:excisionase family DNA binding protein|nr:helix-turn-helix domain-containing protein [Prevotellaceae bacterium]